MANNHSTLTGLFTDIADAIREKTGGTESIVADQFPEAIEGISVGVDTSDATAVAGEILTGKTAYVNGVKLTGTMNKGTEIIVGTFNSSGNTSVTVPEIIGKTNIFAIMTNPTNQSNRYCGAFALVDGVSSTFVSGQGVNGTVTLNTTTGKISVSATNCSGLSSKGWRYIAW